MRDCLPNNVLCHTKRWFDLYRQNRGFIFISRLITYRYGTLCVQYVLLVLDFNVFTYGNLWTLSLLMIRPFLAQYPPVDQGLLIREVFRSHTTTCYNRLDTSGRVISSSQRPLCDNTQHLQQTDIHASGGIGNQNLSRRAISDSAATGNILGLR